MLAQFRQLSPLFARTLLGMLLFVWLTMALAPCVMANSNSAMEMSAMHEQMADCAYCPEAKNTMTSMVLCQNAHGNTSDTMSFVVDSIDAAAFVLFEIPASWQINPLLARNTPADFQRSPDKYPLSPLALTGILRI